MIERKKIIAVIGGSETDAPNLALAEKVGELIAQQGAILITGGMSGVMEAASRGAKRANGLVIGVLPTGDKESANPYVDVPIVTEMSHARNFIIARTCDCAIAIDGKYGTLSEIAFCLLCGTPVVGLNTWNIDAPIIPAQTADEAVAIAFAKTK